MDPCWPEKSGPLLCRQNFRYDIKMAILITNIQIIPFAILRVVIVAGS